VHRSSQPCSQQERSDSRQPSVRAERSHRCKSIEEQEVIDTERKGYVGSPSSRYRISHVVIWAAELVRSGPAISEA